MADPTDADDYGDQGDHSESSVIKALRAKVEAAEKAQVEMAQKLAFHDSGLGDLTDAQREDVLTIAKAKGQTTAEDLKAIADRLSYTKPTEPATETPAPGAAAASTEDAAAAAELAQLANLASGSVPAPQTTINDQLDQFTSSDEMWEFLQAQVGKDFGPSVG
jgi:hypothetical protein